MNTKEWESRNISYKHLINDKNFPFFSKAYFNNQYDLVTDFVVYCP